MHTACTLVGASLLLSSKLGYDARELAEPRLRSGAPVCFQDMLHQLWSLTCCLQNPADNDVKLSTAPDPTGATHWGQQVFYVNPPVDCAPNDMLSATLTLTRKKENHRLLKVEMKVKVGDRDSS